MSWQIAIVLQIIASAVTVLYTRRLSLSVKRVFFGVAVLSYLAVACAGWIYSDIATGSNITFPPTAVWPYLLIEGLCIPAAWLVQYRLISYVGAGNAVIATTLNTLAAAAAGILLLHDKFTVSFTAGAAFLLTGVFIALRLQPDTVHKAQKSFAVKAGLVIVGALLFGIGMYAEKVVINSIGAGEYMGFGWSMQAIGALVLFAFFGRVELKRIDRMAIRKGIVLGILTSIAGGLFVYAVSIGSLSHTIIASSGKAAVVMVLAALFLHERNAWLKRFAAFALSVAGLTFILV